MGIIIFTSWDNQTDRMRSLKDKVLEREHITHSRCQDALSLCACPTPIQACTYVNLYRDLLLTLMLPYPAPLSIQSHFPILNHSQEHASHIPTRSVKQTPTHQAFPEHPPCVSGPKPDPRDNRDTYGPIPAPKELAVWRREKNKLMLPWAWAQLHKELW